MQAREALFTTHLAFARRVARRHWMRGPESRLEFDDLCQLASAGLLEALDHYDPDKGAPFRGYAARRISGSILDGIAKTSEVRQQISSRNRMRRERAKSLATEGHGLSSADALQALIDAAVGLALGFMLEGSGLYAGEGEPDARPNAYESLAWKEAVGRVLSELATLPPREQTIIRRHYLDGLDFEQIAALLALSKGRVSQLHRSALSLLRKRLSRLGQFKLER